ncbi:MAG: hypothetical protein PHR16_05650 [Methylovulum sp.]|nr:hypothetical protein [Methylovulum sp.]
MGLLCHRTPAIGNDASDKADDKVKSGRWDVFDLAKRLQFVENGLNQGMAVQVTAEIIC